MTEEEKREKAIYVKYRDEINQMYDDIMNSGCPIFADNFKVCHYVRDAGYRKEEEVRKETIEEILRFIEMEHYGKAMVTLIEDIKTKFLGWKHPMRVEVEDND